MQNKDLVLEETLERVINNTYLTEIVEEYNQNQTPENFKNLCEVLSYRDIFLGMNIVILDKKLKKKMNKESKMDIEILNNSSVMKEYVKCELSNGEDSKYYLAVFTEPKKVLSSEVNPNTIVNTSFEQLVDQILCNEKCEGIIVNPFEHNVVIENKIVEMIYNKEFDQIFKIKKLFELVDKMKDMNYEISDEDTQTEDEESEQQKELDLILNEFLELYNEFE